MLAYVIIYLSMDICPIPFLTLLSPEGILQKLKTSSLYLPLGVELDNTQGVSPHMLVRKKTSVYKKKITF